MILVDDRIGSAEYSRYLQPCTVTRLESADFAFAGNGPDGTVVIGIERKTLGDLLDCIRSGRLHEGQIPKMLPTYFRSYVIVEGRFSADYDTGDLITYKKGSSTGIRPPGGFKYCAVVNYLNTLSVIFGIHVVRSAYPRDTCFTVTCLYNWWQKDFEKHGKFAAKSTVYSTNDPLDLLEPSPVRRVASCLPGIQRKGFDVDKHFASVYDMVNASEEEWCSIPGIGPGTTSKIMDYIHKGGHKC